MSEPSNPTRLLRVLLVEDSEDDATLLLASLSQAGYYPVTERVETRLEMEAALDRQAWDVVIADYSMPRFSAPAALALLQAKGLDLPVLVVSGTIQDDVAVGLMKLGARDYLMKGNLARLIPAIERELQGASDREAQRLSELERQRMLDALSLYVHPRMAHMVARDASSLQFGGEKRELTVMFSDLRGFSALAESLPAELLVEFLTDYLAEMTEVIFEHGGLVDKYMGDGIMALWGALMPDEDHAASACRAALDMVARLASFNERWQERGLPELAMGIGINTGPAIVGNLGTRRRFTYTAVGDHVNLASRLEELNKRYATTILVSEYTRSLAGEGFQVRALDTVRVKGRQQPVEVFELLSGAGEDDRAFLSGFRQAMAAYRAGEWENAASRFTGLLQARPNDGPSALYLKRCRARLGIPAGVGATRGPI